MNSGQMFNPGMDSARETGAVAGTVLIPMRFVWPYGGRSVFLSGSFNRWSELLPMSPVEGCPTVFQIIWSISPGYHQYKFCVDGEWRHDEHQPYTSSEYGIVNTVLLATEPNFGSGINPLAPAGSSMDVDNTAFNRVVRISDGTLTEAIPRISEADLQVSCHRVSAFLSAHTAYELLPESGKVVALDIDLPVKQAFHILYEQGISMAPLWDFCKGRFVGVLSASDFILILREVCECKIKIFVTCEAVNRKELNFYGIVGWITVIENLLSLDAANMSIPRKYKLGKRNPTSMVTFYMQLGNHGSNLTEEELETHTISAWKEGKAYMNRQIDGHGRAFSKPLIHAGPNDNLKDLALKILQNQVAAVPIIHSSTEDGSFPQLLHLASLAGILKCICRYFRHCCGSLPVLKLPICSIPVGTWVPKIGEPNRRPLAMLRPSASLSAALNLLVQGYAIAQVSSIPIVDDNDSLLDIYCRSDITALAKDRAYAHINLNEMTIHQVIIVLLVFMSDQLIYLVEALFLAFKKVLRIVGLRGSAVKAEHQGALQLGQDSYSPYELRSQRCQMCLPSDSLHKVMERLANPGVRRLVIVEAGSKRVEGIVSLSDIFRFLLG
ncbi:hypothetical protein JRO89_XS03G0176900 [Xanthoceras sorbifolium]|uniref:CBS domain-containing protein n=1 Tax=Xanthoceras sorbifolium TaxID=99658 RepID=A0ABQ8IAD7_9ROSI|nr:hypothetical protein JRO89_XS03G0176900 [Xanthoceras sorbifolium]